MDRKIYLAAFFDFLAKYAITADNIEDFYHNVDDNVNAILENDDFAFGNLFQSSVEIGFKFDFLSRAIDSFEAGFSDRPFISDYPPDRGYSIRVFKIGQLIWELRIFGEYLSYALTPEERRIGHIYRDDIFLYSSLYDRLTIQMYDLYYAKKDIFKDYSQIIIYAESMRGIDFHKKEELKNELASFVLSQADNNELSELFRLHSLLVLRRKKRDGRLPMWGDQQLPPELQNYKSPEFLKAVYASLIIDGTIERSAVRELDPKLLSDVEQYIFRRSTRKSGPGLAEGIVFRDGKSPLPLSVEPETPTTHISQRPKRSKRPLPG